MTLKKLTLPELLKNSCSKFSKNLSLNFVASGKKTYQDLYNEVVSIANHLLHLGVKKGDKVAILSANMPNWGITQFAMFYRTPEYIGTCGGKSDLRFPPTGKMFGRSKNTIP